jgi:uncharacterized repeat protein (TIGR01451 family)
VTLSKTTQQTTLGTDQRITYTLVVRNAGETLAAQTLISDPLPSALSFISASPWPSLPPADSAPLVWAVGDLPPGQSLTITLVTQLKSNATLAGTRLVNTAYALGDMQTITRTDDLQSSATTVLQPSAITLASFNAVMEGTGVRLAWRTSLEQNTFGFFVLRSATGNRADAQRVSAEIMPAGANDYTLFDAAGSINSVYWLQEIELDGATRDAGPYRVSALAVAAPAQQAIAQPAVIAQSAPVMAAMDMPAQAVVLPEANFPAPAQATAAPQTNAPAPASSTSMQATHPVVETPSPSTTQATVAMDTPPAPATAAPAMQPPAAQTTPMAQPPPLDALGMMQVISVQRGNATPRATAVQSEAPAGDDMPMQAVLLVAGVGLMGLLVMGMAFTSQKQRRRK